MTIKELIRTGSLHFILFGGKGGVGKTTCAAAAAVMAADQGKKVLIISTDPAHSLADSLGITKIVPGEVTKVEEVENLWALEIKPKMKDEELELMMNQSNSEFGEVISMLGDTGSATPPGMDEAMAFGKVVEFLENTDYDLVIFDTAPTGHTLRLLSIPTMLSGWMGKILSMKLKLGKLMGGLKSLFGNAPNADAESLEALNKLKKSLENVRAELSNPDKTTFVIVMISELMAIYETERLLGTLIDYEIPVEYMIVNQLIPPNDQCSFCQQRYKMQQKHLKEIRDLYSEDYKILELMHQPLEVRKVDKLRKFAEFL